MKYEDMKPGMKVKIVKRISPRSPIGGFSGSLPEVGDIITLSNAFPIPKAYKIEGLPFIVEPTMVEPVFSKPEGEESNGEKLRIKSQDFRQEDQE
jgi:hypothetical protein